MSLTLRSWATPLVAGSFALMAVTGTTMFFHVNSQMAKGLHEWAGWLLLAGGAAHLVLNRRALTTYFRRPAARIIIGAGLAVAAVTLLPIGPSDATDGPAAVLDKVAHAPVPVLAQLSLQTPDEVIADLVRAGFPDATGASTIAGLAGGDAGRQMGAMMAVLAD